MWKRLQGHVRDGHFRDKDKQIGSPVLVETTYDEDRLRHIPNVAQAQDANYQQPYAPPQPQYSHRYKSSEVPTVSSIYSQPSPELTCDYHSPIDDQRFDVSPPSSPEPDRYQQENSGPPRRFRSMRDVSPVDETRARSMTSPRGGSHIPVLRKTPHGLANQDVATTHKFWGGKVAPDSKVRWDEYSGEPTSSNAGKTAQVSPGSYQKGGVSPPSTRLRETGYSVTVTGNARKNQSLAERATRYGTKSAKDTRPREPWSRASGRTEIVKPLMDQPSDTPLQFRKAKTVRTGEFGKNASSSLKTHAARVPEEADTTPVSNTPATHDTHEEPVKPTVPLKVVKTSPSRELASPTSPLYPGTSNHYTYSPITPTNKLVTPAPTTRDNVAKSDPVQPEPTTPTAKVAQKPRDETPRPPDSNDDVPGSRFSWTTYNSGTTYQHSPPPSPPPPLPTSRVPSEPASAASAILSRKRPIPAADRVPARKPIASSVASNAASTARNTMVSDPPSPRPDSTFSASTHKALPRPPTELAAADHIEILESQMEDLRVRRNNVYRLLNDLNTMAPPNPMITDFKRMRLVEQRKKDFEDELAEIKREEHQVGLQLHRAWRKRESADPGSESTLWVRRVTR